MAATAPTTVLATAATMVLATAATMVLATAASVVLATAATMVLATAATIELATAASVVASAILVAAASMVLPAATIVGLPIVGGFPALGMPAFRHAAVGLPASMAVAASADASPSSMRQRLLARKSVDGHVKGISRPVSGGDDAGSGVLTPCLMWRVYKPPERPVGIGATGSLEREGDTCG
ncbi:hypothetical protein MMPV_008235 [Pyropia vietnamensis]